MTDIHPRLIMDARLQRRVQRYGWDKAAPYYEAYWREQLRPSQDLLLRMADLQPGERVLDVACGTGIVSFEALGAVGSDGEVVGTDISDRMVEACREIAGQQGIRNARFVQSDAEELDLPDEAFDCALCSLGLMYVVSPEKALVEMRRVLRPSGRAVASVWGERANCGWAEIFPIVDARVSTEVCPLFFQMGTQDMLARAMEAAGFRNVETERLRVTLSYASGEDACGAAFDGGPVALAYSRFDEPTRAEVRAEYLASIEPYRTDGGYRIPGEFVVARGET